MIALLALLLAAASPAARQDRFLELLRTYPSRPADQSAGLVQALIDEGPFAERDRALYWLGSVRLNARDRAGARREWARLRREHPGSPWLDKADLGEADASAQEREFGAALQWLERAGRSQDPSVRELARLTSAQLVQARARQRWAWAAGLFAIAVFAALVSPLARRAPLSWSPLPAESRILLPVLAVLALLSLRQDPAPREAALTICASAALLVTASGARLRAVRPGAAGRALSAGAALLALLASGYVALYRADLINMVVETFRAGPE